MTDATPPGLTRPEILKVFTGLMIGLLLAALDGTIVATALPTMAGELGGIEYLPWVFTAYLLTSTVTVPLYGKFSDLYGRKRLFQIAIVVFIVGSVTSGAAQTMLQLVTFRALQGVGAGGLVTLAMTIVGDILPPRERGRYQGYITSVFAFASITGPLMGGFFVDHLSWRWAFFVNVPLSILALVMTERNLTLPFARREHRIDLAGALLLTGSIVSLLLVTVFAEHGGWASPRVGILGTLGLGGLVAFARHERRVAEPILPLSLFNNDIFNVANGLNLLMGVALFSAVVYLPLYLQVSLGVSATVSGLHVMPMSVALLVSSIYGGRLVTRTGRYKRCVVAGSGLLMVGSGVLTLLQADSSRFLASLGVGIVGVGIGVAMPVLTVAIQNAVDPRHLGTATAMTDFSRKLGGVFGVSLLGALMNARVSRTFSASLESGALPADTDASGLLDAPARIAELPGPVQLIIRSAVADGAHLVFLVGFSFAVLAFALTWRLREIALRDDLPAIDVTGEGPTLDEHATDIAPA